VALLGIPADAGPVGKPSVDVAAVARLMRNLPWLVLFAAGDDSQASDSSSNEAILSKSLQRARDRSPRR
jgi:hypothetical protein